MPLPTELNLCRDLVLVSELPLDEETDAGLYIPETGERPDIIYGEVKAVGPRCHELQPGDHVLFHRFKGYEVMHSHDDPPLLALREREIYAKKVEG